MEGLKGTILAILEALPENQLIPQEELDRRVLRCGHPNIKLQDITTALLEINDAQGLVIAFIETDDMKAFCVALRSKVKRLPLGTFVAKGFEPRGRESRRHVPIVADGNGKVLRFDN